MADVEPHHYDVIRRPLITEKSTLVAEQNKIVFEVAPTADKAAIKEAVEALFKVKVETVTTLRVKGKMKRNRFGYTTKPSWKKAYVTVAQGQEIDLATVE